MTTGRRSPFSLVFLVAALLIRVSGAAVATTDAAVGTTSRTDQRSTGNRVAEGRGLDGTWLDVQLGAAPAWVLADPTALGRDWLVAFEDGSVVRVRVPADGDPAVGEQPLAVLLPGEPPLATASGDGAVVVTSAIDAVAVFDDAVPDARLVSASDGTLVALTQAAERYPHGVLGDGFEAASVSVQRPDGTLLRIDVGPDGVVEGLTPILLDLDGDSVLEIVVTISDTLDGARLVAFDLNGERVASSDPIGQGFRWLHQIGGGSVGPEAETEIVVVRTPHIGGIVEAYRLVDDRLQLVAREPGYSSHRIGSPNLDMALLADVDVDGGLDVVVPSDDMRTLGLLTPTIDDFESQGSLALDGTLVTNIAAARGEAGGLVLAVGIDDGRLRIFR